MSLVFGFLYFVSFIIYFVLALCMHMYEIKFKNETFSFAAVFFCFVIGLIPILGTVLFIIAACQVFPVKETIEELEEIITKMIKGEK